MTEMMTMTAVRPAAAKDKNDCHCGCGTHGDCCELECLVHPRFFCGQLLADQDLTAVVDWVKAKSALARFRHGWGVVCGLDVHCGKHGTVVVSPGYAMDCCGRDVVVCEDTIVDLVSCWQRPDDPCADDRPRMRRTFQPGHAAADRFGIPRAEVQAVDVFIRYKETQTDSRNDLARGGCGGSGGCEYTRVHEGAEIYCRPAEDECDVPADPWIAWETDYVEGLRTLRRDLDRILALESPAERLLEYIGRHPLHSFCFVRDWLCSLERPRDPNQPVAADTLRGDLSEIAFWIVQDWRNQYLQKPCRGCGPDTGIRLARVWIWMRRDSRGREALSTIYVNAYPPFRRPIANEEWLAPADKINLAPYVWQPVDASLQAMRRAGLAPTAAALRPDFHALPAQEVILADFSTMPATNMNETLTVYWTPDPHCEEHRRIVGFSRGTTAAGTVTAITPAPLTPAEPATQPPAPEPRPAVQPQPATPRVDDLTLLDGIGDGIANRLRNAGINTVAELAGAAPEQVRNALGGLRVTDARIDEMIAQAKAHVS